MAACFGDNTLRRMLHGEIMHSGLSPESMNCTVDSLEIVDPATLLYLAEFIRIDQDASEQLDQFAILRQLDSIFSAPLLCMNKEEWEAEYEDVLKVDAVDLRQLRCLVKELGRENFERLINSDYTPSLEVLILAANCQVALEALLLGPVTPEAVPTVPPAAPTTTSLPQAEPEATPASQARAVVQVPTTDPVETVQPGMLAPDFDLRFYEDRAEESLSQRLSDLRGTPVVLLFWFPDCEPCKTNLANMENEFRGARWVGAKFIGVQILGSPQEGQATVADSGLSSGITHIKLPGSKQRTILDESHRSITHGCRQPSNQAHKTISRRGELAAPGSGGGFHHVCTPFKLLRARTSPLVASLHL